MHRICIFDEPCTLKVGETSPEGTDLEITTNRWIFGAVSGSVSVQLKLLYGQDGVLVLERHNLTYAESAGPKSIIVPFSITKAEADKIAALECRLQFHAYLINGSGLQINPLGNLRPLPTKFIASTKDRICFGANVEAGKYRWTMIYPVLQGEDPGNPTLAYNVIATGEEFFCNGERCFDQLIDNNAQSDSPISTAGFDSLDKYVPINWLKIDDCP